MENMGSGPYGAYDMAGNVWEWVTDWYDKLYYNNSPESNPSGPSIGSSHIVRGGSWYNNVRLARSAFRFSYNPHFTNRDDGFRCARLP